MKTHVVIDGNAFYEIDEECQKKREQTQYLKKKRRKEQEPDRTRKEFKEE